MKKVGSREGNINTQHNTQQPTRATNTLLPLAFPSSLSVGTAAVPSNHNATAPPRHVQAVSRQDLVAFVSLIAGKGKKRGIKNIDTMWGMNFNLGGHNFLIF